MSESTSPADPHRALVPLLMQHERQIFAYIYTLVPNRHDAQDILQETCLTIYDKFVEFTPGTDFMAWAMRIAWWKVRAARQKFARAKVVFNDEVMEAVSHTAATMADFTAVINFITLAMAVMLIGVVFTGSMLPIFLMGPRMMNSGNM